jgi:hypothetical protein
MMHYPIHERALTRKTNCQKVRRKREGVREWRKREREEWQRIKARKIKWKKGIELRISLRAGWKWRKREKCVKVKDIVWGIDRQREKREIDIEVIDRNRGKWKV